MQVSSLQKLIGEKDGQVNQTKAKAREQNNSNAARLRQAEETLKENVASSSQTIEKLNKELQVRLH